MRAILDRILTLLAAVFPDLGTVVTATIRTFVPAVVGLVILFASKVGINLDNQALTSVIGGAFIGAYYFVVTFLERKVSPKFGWLLGAPKAPTYSAPAGPAPDQPAV